METFCSICKNEIQGKPWISIRCDKDCIIHGCSYLCDTKMNTLVGDNYIDKVINKEDFNYLFPVIHNNKPIVTNSYERDELLQEIEEEERRINELEWEYQQTSSDSDDWENSEE